MSLASEDIEVAKPELLRLVVPLDLSDASSRRNGSASGLLRRTLPAPSVNCPDRLWTVPSGLRRASRRNEIGPSADSGGGFLSNTAKSARLTSRAESASVGALPTEARASIDQGPVGLFAESLAVASLPERSKARLKSS